MSDTPHPMRRKERALPRAEALALLNAATVATLSMVTEDGPYAVPVSPVCIGETLYFHSAQKGRKVEALKRDPRVWLSVFGEATSTNGDPAEMFSSACQRFSMYFSSAMAWGNLREVTDEAEKVAALRALCEKFTPAHMDGFAQAIAESLKITAVYALSLENVSGKAKKRRG